MQIPTKSCRRFYILFTIFLSFLQLLCPTLAKDGQPLTGKSSMSTTLGDEKRARFLGLGLGGDFRLGLGFSKYDGLGLGVLPSFNPYHHHHHQGHFYSPGGYGHHQPYYLRPGGYGFNNHGGIGGYHFQQQNYHHHGGLSPYFGGGLGLGLNGFGLGLGGSGGYSFH